VKILSDGKIAENDGREVSAIGRRELRSIYNINIEGSHRLHGKAAASEKTGKILPLGKERKIVVGETKLSPKTPYPPSSKSGFHCTCLKGTSSSSGNEKNYWVYCSRDVKVSAIRLKRAAEEVKY
jgi:hypothetical protein